MRSGTVRNCTRPGGIRTGGAVLAWTLVLAACSRDPGSDSASDPSLVSDGTGDTGSWSILDLDARIEVPARGRPEGVVALQLDDDAAAELVIVARRPGSEAGVLEVFDDVLEPSRSVELPGYPIGPVAFEDGGPRVAVASRSTDELLVYDPLDLTQPLRRVALPGRPRALGVGPLREVGTNTLVVATNAGTLLTIDGDQITAHELVDGQPTFVAVEPSMIVVGSQAAFGLRRYFVEGDALTALDLEPTGGIPRAWRTTPTGEFVTSGDDALLTRTAQGWERYGAAGRVPLDVRPLGAGQLVSLSFVDLALRVWRDGQPHARIEAGQDPWAFDLADVDGDGVHDLVVANRALERVSLVLGDPAGGFRPTRALPTGEGPKQLVAGDFDGDGALDVGAVNVLDATIAVHLGDGAGHLGEAQLTPTGPGVFAIAAGRELDEGGPLRDALTWYREEGGGFVRTVGELHDGRLQTRDLPRSDVPFRCTGVTQDPRTYLVGYDGAVQEFGPLYDHSDQVWALIDGIPTAAAASEFGGQEVVLVGYVAADGPRLEVHDRGSEDVRSIPVDGVPESVTWLQADADPELEFAVLVRGETDNSPGRVRLFDHRGGAFEVRETHATGLRPFALAAGDVDGDGLDDVVVSAQNSHHLNFWRGGEAELTRMPDLGCGRGPLGVLVVDLDHDGRAEVVCANNFSNDLTVIRAR